MPFFSVRVLWRTTAMALIFVFLLTACNRSYDFVSVEVGDYHSCGVTTDGFVVCWGKNTDARPVTVGQADPPRGEFSSVSGGGGITRVE